MSYALITVRFTLRALAVTLIGLGMVVSLLVILITALINLTESTTIMPTTTSITTSPSIDDSSVHNDDQLDEMADMTFTCDELMSMTEIDELVASLPVDEMAVEFVGYQSLKWNELRSVCKAMGIKGCKTRAQYEAAYELLLTSSN